jgi:hypothetical protein
LIENRSDETVPFGLALKVLDAFGCAAGVVPLIRPLAS